MRKPCPPPERKDEDAVLDLTDREADWQAYGQPAAEADDGRPF